MSDNGPEFTGLAILRWAQTLRIDWRYIDPGEPPQNALSRASFERRRDEFLNETLFASLSQCTSRAYLKVL